MAAKFEKLPNEPIIIQTMDEDHTFSKDGMSNTEIAINLLDQQTEPVFFIVDFLAVSPSFSEVIVGTNLVVRQMKLLSHPKIRENILVTTNPVLTLAAKGLDSSVYGNVHIKVCTTMSEALAHARQAK